MSFLPLRALAVVGISLMISACGSAIGAAQGPGEVGKRAPSLAIQSLNGKGAVSLTATAGKVTVVEFWATWCEPCKKSLTQLEDLRTRSSGNLEVIGISVDDSPSGVAEYAKAQGLSFPIAWDENRSLMFRWSVAEVPATFILDGKGRIRFVHEPDKNKDQAEVIAREIALLDNEASPSPSDAKTEVASSPSSAPQRVALAVAVSEPAPAPPTTPAPAVEETTSTAAPSEASPASASKTRAKPSAAKKGGAKKATKKKS